MTADLGDTFCVVWWLTPDEIHTAADETGRLLIFGREQSAGLFAWSLESYGFNAVVVPCSPQEAGELLDAHGIPESEFDHRMITVEAQATSEADAERWIVELADRVAEDVANGYANAYGYRKWSEVTDQDFD